MFYQADVYRFDLSENPPNSVHLTINNAISWDYLRLTMTKEELKGLIDYMTKYMENPS